MLRPISSLQKAFITCNVKRLGLNRKLQSVDGDLDRLFSKRRKVAEVKRPNHVPFTLGLTTDGQLGIETSYHHPFTDTLAAKLPDEEFYHLVENGFTPHQFHDGQELIFSLAFQNTTSESTFRFRFTLALDVFDFSSPQDLVGTFNASINPHEGIMKDSFAPHFDFQPAFTEFLKSLKISSWELSHDIMQTRHKLAGTKKIPMGFTFVNFSIAPAYRHKGGKGFSTLSQILISTAMRLAGEQFLCRAYCPQQIEGDGAKFRARYFRPQQPLRLGKTTEEAFSLTN